MLYTTKEKLIGNSDQLAYLAHEAGEVWSNTVVKYWRIVRHSQHWLSKKSMQKLIKNTNLHSQTVQGITDIFYEAMSSWRELRKTDPKANPPRKRKWYSIIPFKESAIKVENGILKLSTGKGNKPLELPWEYDETPRFCEISYTGTEYKLNAVFSTEPIESIDLYRYGGVDLGEVHIAVAHTGESVVVANGKELRSKRNYQNKVKGKFQRKMSKCKKSSRRWKKLNRAKKRTLKKLDNQINDIMHKQTTALVYALLDDGVKMVGIGDVRNIRKSVDKNNPHASQNLHQMLTGRARHLITHKCLRLGMSVELIDEAYTTQTCPRCFNLNKPDDRNYLCKSCGFTAHRDAVGSYHIRALLMYQEFVPVVGEMTPPVGIWYYANTSPCTSVSADVKDSVAA